MILSKDPPSQCALKYTPKVMKIKIYLVNRIFTNISRIVVKIEHAGSIGSYTCVLQYLGRGYA